MDTCWKTIQDIVIVLTTLTLRNTSHLQIRVGGLTMQLYMISDSAYPIHTYLIKKL
jgi:hypothetical protein